MGCCQNHEFFKSCLIFRKQVTPYFNSFFWLKFRLILTTSIYAFCCFLLPEGFAQFFCAVSCRVVLRGHNTKLNHCTMPSGILFGLLSKSQNFQIMHYLENKLHLILIDFFVQISSYFNGFNLCLLLFFVA